MRKIVVFSLFLSMLCSFSSAQDVYTPTQGNLEVREEFQDNKFGVFIHWGIYSMLADGEWIMNNRNINYKDYAKLAEGFYPSKFDAAEWVSIVKNAGAKYICITTRHHDGFSMFDSKYTDYNIVDATPFKRDIIKELAEECQKQGIKLHFYYSHADWGRLDYPHNLGKSGLNTGRPDDKINWDSYYAFMNNQLRELLTNYGPIGAIWFDGCWDTEAHPDFDWHLPEQYKLIHSIQPSCLIGNNHHKATIPGEDIQIFERDLPGENTAGFSGNQKISRLPLESCSTLSGMWGYGITDKKFISDKEFVHLLVKAAGKNANLLMNVGPMPNGEFPSESVELFKQIGKWLSQYGETIYGTRGGPITPRDWGVTTQKGNKIYVHILDYEDQVLYLPVTDKKIKTAQLFKDGSEIKFKQDKKGVYLEFDKVPDDIDYVVELNF